MTTTRNLKVSAIICAAGKGERAGFGKNKLLCAIGGAPVIYHTLKAFDIPEISEIILACAAEDTAEMRAIASPFNCKIVKGGSTRTETVKNALKEVTGDVTLIHDGARPFVSRAIIKQCIETAKEYSSAICAVPATDTVARTDYAMICDIPPRGEMYLLQTPQGFTTESITHAYELAGDKEYSDDSAVYAEFCAKPRIFSGSRENIKLTYPEDFTREYPPLRAAGRVGFGVDVHAFSEGNGVTLGGVRIPHSRGLEAHSDGDVVFHALMDALLSAAGLKDIGRYFPPDDKKYLNADSGKLLEKVIKTVRKVGLKPANIAITIQAESPKLATYIDKMVANTAAICGLDAGDVGISAGTCERLGFVGENLGICAYCAVSLKEVKN